MYQPNFSPGDRILQRSHRTNQPIYMHQPMCNGHQSMSSNTFSYQTHSYVAQSYHYSMNNNVTNFSYLQTNPSHTQLYGNQYFQHYQQNSPNQLIPTPPPIECSDSYAHYRYIQNLKSNYTFTDINCPPPYYLITYLLKYLSFQHCPYSLSALSFIAVNVPHFYVHFAPHQLHFLQKIIQQKYPSHIDYKKQYMKLLVLDRGQAYKLVDLLQTICILVSQFEEQKKCFQNMSGWEMRNQYLIWATNCLQVMITHVQTLQNHYQFNQKKSIEETNIPRLKQNIINQTDQIVSLLCCLSTQKHDQSTWHKIYMIIFDLLPSNHIVTQNQLVPISKLIDITAKVKHFPTQKYHYTHKLKYNTISDHQLYNFLYGTLINQIKKISNRILKIEGKLCENQKVLQLHKLFCFKVLNTLSLKRWAKQQKLQLIQLISGCSIICGVNSSKFQSKQKIYSDLILFAFEITKQKNVPPHHQLYTAEHFPLMDTNQLNDEDRW